MKKNIKKLLDSIKTTFGKVEFNSKKGGKLTFRFRQKGENGFWIKFKKKF